MSNTDPIINQEWTQVFAKGQQDPASNKTPTMLLIESRHQQTNQNNTNKTWALLQITAGKDEFNICFFNLLVDTAKSIYKNFMNSIPVRHEYYWFFLSVFTILKHFLLYHFVNRLTNIYIIYVIL
jgi:hypothetical protein